MTKIRYALEAIFLHILFLFFRLLPPKTASNIGGWIGHTIGPRLATSRKALRNLQRALPDMEPARQQEVITDMWEHLGRIIAEYSHLATHARDHTEIENAQRLHDLKANGQNAIFFGAHFGNWELNAPAVVLQCDADVDVSYRAPNNPWVDRLLMKARSMNGRIKGYAKSRQGGKGMMATIKNGGSLGILIDQKYNEGLSVPFFGMEAMTNPFFVQLAQKYKCALVPIRNTRLDGASFRLNIFDPIDVFDDEGKPRPVEDVIGEAHALLESWIIEKPEQWLWLHRRWPTEKAAHND
jgi:KDO2-lipid IV(A) lauroyltransferase